MKTKLVISAVLAMLMLSGCSKGTELIDDIQSAEETSAAENADETEYTFGGQTETAVTESETEPAETEASGTESSEAENPAADVSRKTFDYGSLSSDEDAGWRPGGNYFIKDGIFCADYGVFPDKGEDFLPSYQLRFYDMRENKLLETIDIPEGFGPCEVISEVSGDIFCKYVTYRSVYDENNDSFNEDYSVITVRSDLSYDITGGYTAADSSLEVCGHNILERDPDITDADSGSVLAAGKAAAGDDDFSGTRQTYCFPVDGNRFVYRTLGYERLPGFGIYDFSAGTAKDVPDSKDLIPLGVHGGRIYSVKTAWDGYGTELYITDTETLETEFFMDCPITVEANDYVEYAMPESGNFIAMKYQPEDGGSPAVLYSIDPDTKDYVSENIPEDFKYYSLTRSGDAVLINSPDSETLLVAEMSV